MHFFITGGTGFIGQHLIQALIKRGDTVSVLVRDRPKAEQLFNRQAVTLFNTIDEALLSSQARIDGVVNLAGEPIIDRRWSNTRKQILLQSRVTLTQQLVDTFKQMEQAPTFLISGSAVGYYGNHPNDTPIDEDTPQKQPTDFPSELCQAWEAAANEAQALGIRVCSVRTGIVLDKHHGALKKMWLPFSLGLGGTMGNGQQWFPWIHIKDMIKLLLFLSDHSQLSGAFNASAPTPVNNVVLTQTLAKVMRRPALLPVPATLLRWLMGESSQLLLEGQKVIPKKLLDQGFTFEFNHIEDAFAYEASR